jgi:hypothetical protein
MKLNWPAVQHRYRAETAVAPLSGASRLRAVLVDHHTIRVTQRLWTMLITREDLETAVGLLDRTPKPVTSVEFAERLRTFYASTTECSRIPNVTAILLTDLGLLPASA